MTSALAVPPAGQAEGSQTPRIESVPKFSTGSGDEAVELAAQCGLMLDPWQQHVLRGALGERADGRWAARDVGLVVGRQNGKGAILEARELAGLFLFGERLILHTAHQYKTSHEAFLRIKALVDNTDWFRSRVARMPSSTQGEGIELRSGQRLMFIARSVNGSGRGFSADTLILDEAMRLPEEAAAALLPTLSARPNPQVWYTASAGFVDSEVLKRLRERGMSGTASSLAYFEWSAEAGSNPLDRAAWAAANPGLGLRITDEAIEAELVLDPVDFARERLGIWQDESAQSMFKPGEWAACRDPGSNIEGPPTFAVAVSNDRSWSVIAAAGQREDGKRHVEVIENRRGTAWVAGRCAELMQSWGGDVFLNPSSPAASLKQDLDDTGVAYREVTANEMNQACGLFYDEVVEGALRHLDQDVLNKAVGQAVTRPSGDGAWVWSQSKSPIDVSPLVAVTLAGWACAESLASPSVFLA